MFGNRKERYQHHFSFEDIVNRKDCTSTHPFRKSTINICSDATKYDGGGHPSVIHTSLLNGNNRG